MCESTLTVTLPSWLQTYRQGYRQTTDRVAQMQFVIEAARLTWVNGAGNPFGAAVFEVQTGKLVALGVNLVRAETMSTLHAEVTALMFAHRELDCVNLNTADGAPYRLVSSTEPCAMCMGAIHWSGIREIVSGATDADARSVGFDEGEKPADWISAMNRRGITVVTEVARAKAVDVLSLIKS